MFESMLLLIALMLCAYVWQNALRARELARQLCHDLCVRANVQLLDQTVALHRLRLLRGPPGLVALRRDYRFDFSVDGRDRHRGTLSLLDGRVQSHSLPVVDHSIEVAGSNIVRFPGPSLDRH